MTTDSNVVVAQIVEELSPLGSNDVRPDANLISELGFDSLGLIELLVSIEDALDLAPLDAEDLDDVRRVADLERVVNKALAQQTSS